MGAEVGLNLLVNWIRWRFLPMATVILGTTHKPNRKNLRPNLHCITELSTLNLFRGKGKGEGLEELVWAGVCVPDPTPEPLADKPANFSFSPNRPFHTHFRELYCHRASLLSKKFSKHQFHAERKLFFQAHPHPRPFLPPSHSEVFGCFVLYKCLHTPRVGTHEVNESHSQVLHTYFDDK